MKSKTLGDVARALPLPLALKRAQEDAKKSGASKLTNRQINAEIKAARREMRSRNVRAKTGS